MRVWIWVVVICGLGAVAEAGPPAGTLIERCRNASGVEDKQVREGSYYFLCVDAFEAQRDFHALDCENGRCTPTSTFRVNREFHLNVWTESTYTGEATLGGVPGLSTGVYSPPGALKLMGAAEPALNWFFSPRLAAAVTLSVTVTDGTKTVQFTRELIVGDTYRILMRVGLGMTWLPGAYKTGILTTADGMRYAERIEGTETDGLVRSEIVTGFTWLPFGMPSGSLSPKLGIGLRIGLLSLGSDTKALSSATLGVEAAFGPDLSIGLFGGIARYDAPNAGFERGHLVPTGVQTIPTHIAFNGVVAVMLNFTPGMSSLLKVSQ